MLTGNSRFGARSKKEERRAVFGQSEYKTNVLFLTGRLHSFVICPRTTASGIVGTTYAPFQTGK
jgi:hypothetical protein